jgi:NTE family protein
LVSLPPKSSSARTRSSSSARPCGGGLDHTEFDRSLSEHFTAVDIEDLERQFFAVSTNLSRNVAHCIDRGPLWQAIRASAAIPALLPPVFTADGEMLVDGSLVENVPLRTMLAMKSGPNIVIDFHTENTDRCTVDSSTLPARGELVMRMLSLRSKTMLPSVPGPQSVLLRSLMLNRPDYTVDLGIADILLRPTIPAGIGHLDWHRHAELRQAAREYAAAELERLRADGHALLQPSSSPA